MEEAKINFEAEKQLLQEMINSREQAIAFFHNSWKTSEALLEVQKKQFAEAAADKAVGTKDEARDKFEAEKKVLVQTIRAREEALESWQAAKLKVDKEMDNLALTANSQVATAQRSAHEAEQAMQDAIAKLKAENAMLMATSSIRGNPWPDSNGDNEQLDACVLACWDDA